MADAFQEFPKWVYHKHSTPSRPVGKTVASADEQAALEVDWIPSPHALAVLHLKDAPAEPGRRRPTTTSNRIVPPDMLGFLQSLRSEIQTFVAGGWQFSVFDDEHGPIVIGGPDSVDERRRQQRGLEDLIEQVFGTHVLTTGLKELIAIAFDYQFECAYTLDLPGRPRRVDRIGEVLEFWVQQLIKAGAARANEIPTSRDVGTHSRKRPQHQVDDQTPEQRAIRRQSVIDSLLDEFDLTLSGWATKAGVGPSVTLNYYSGKTKRLHSHNRRALTRVLGKPLDFLPL
jgi:hypothetical protein